MTKKALIIFVRNPVLGKVKTRIAESAGEHTALRIYKELLRHTHDISIAVNADKYVFYSDYPQLADIWEDDVYHKFLQSGETLGDKMQASFGRIFGNGFEKAVIIGSDCYELTSEILEKAFEALNNNDVVIGPAKDGGYYLLGMKKLIPDIFKNKEWSAASVYKKTIDDLEKAGISYRALPLLSDVDIIEDVPGELLNLKKTS